MSILDNLEPKRVFHYFEEISAIPRGSGNMEKITAYCIDFAKKHSLSYHTDELGNVVIFKEASKGKEDLSPIILQGHLDIVCQKTPECDIDFEKDGLSLYVDGDFVKAKGTTLGADNGIAVAMVLSILESDTYEHPPIEAVFTTDEETGMYGAKALDMTILKGTRMINLDSEEDDCVTVSCAGGSDFVATLDYSPIFKSGDKVTLEVKGLKGGHSGVEINSGRINANILLGNILNLLNEKTQFDIISINGGDKPNAITNFSSCELCVENAEAFAKTVDELIDSIKADVQKIEKDFCVSTTVYKNGEFSILPSDIKDTVIKSLCTAPNGVLKMSDKIESLVETSLNLGILKTDSDSITMHYSLRSNTNDGLKKLEDNLIAIFTAQNYTYEAFGHYPPWEYNEKSSLRDLYIEAYKEHFNNAPRVEAIHAGLECGVFASAINDFDCIAVGPTIFDVHTVNEKLCISSTYNLFKLIVDILAKLQ